MDDLISRQAAIDALTDENIIEHLDSVYDSELHRFKRATERIIAQLPPAQPEPIRINLNEWIKVKLTDWGKEIYYHQYDRTNQIAGRKICKPQFPKEDENGYTEFQLWCFIELYGEHIGMTLPNVIEPLEIVKEIDKAYEEILQLPSAEPERKTGKWIQDGPCYKGGFNWMHCSECGHKEIDCPAARTNYCPNCGAKMK